MTRTDMRRLVAAVATALLLALPATAAARPVERADAVRPASQARAMQAGGVGRWMENVARTWARQYGKRVAKAAAKKAAAAATTWALSGGTRCDFPLPKSFCAPRSHWGVGLALAARDGRRPGLWPRVTKRPARAAGALTPGVVYSLTCWAHGDWSGGPSGFNNLWYRLPWGSYVAAVWLYTGTNHRIPGVPHCHR